jgi:hypothetical protein
MRTDQNLVSNSPISAYPVGEIGGFDAPSANHLEPLWLLPGWAMLSSMVDSHLKATPPQQQKRGPDGLSNTAPHSSHI